jgi:hypothetical protein
MEKKEWIPGEPLLDEPHCENWKEIIDDETVTPIGGKLKFKRGAGKHFS